MTTRLRNGGVATVKMFNFVALDCFKPVLAHGVVVTACRQCCNTWTIRTSICRTALSAQVERHRA
jgi:hypothetical protein